MATLTLRDVRKSFGTTEVIKGLDLDIEDREFVVLVGPSGCGKSTLLRLIAGLEEVTSGSLEIDGGDVTGLPPAKRGLSMVFQSYALYPHMSVAENMAFGLKVAGENNSEIDERVRDAAKILELGALLERRPKDLSGGQRQRVAIGRAIVRNPKAFLFDEPLSNLDASLRVQMRIEIARLHQDLESTMIYVTHDQVEAMTLADKIVVLRSGIIEQVGSPLALYDHPANEFVAQFIGSPNMNIVDCTPEEGGFRLAGQGRVEMGQMNGHDQVRRMGIRPEHIAVTAPAEGHCKGRVIVAERLGSDTFLYVQCEGLGQLTVRVVGRSTQEPGTEVGLRYDPALCHLFQANGTAIGHSA